MSNKDIMASFKSRLLDKLTEVPYYIADGLHDYAQDVAKSAREMAPRDTGELENSFVVVADDGADLNVMRVTILVDPDSPASEYAEEISEALPPAPGAEWNLGPGSKAKQKQHPDVLVGGQFLERALVENELDLTPYVKEALKK